MYSFACVSSTTGVVHKQRKKARGRRGVIQMSTSPNIYISSCSELVNERGRGRRLKPQNHVNVVYELPLQKSDGQSSA